jgi:hypothetical protein
LKHTGPGQKIGKPSAFCGNQKGIQQGILMVGQKQNGSSFRNTFNIDDFDAFKVKKQSQTNITSNGM